MYSSFTLSLSYKLQCGVIVMNLFLLWLLFVARHPHGYENLPSKPRGKVLFLFC